MVRSLLAGSAPDTIPAPADPTPPRVVQAQRLDPAALSDEPSVTAFRDLDGAWVAQMKDAEVLVVDGAFCVLTLEGAALVDGLARASAPVFGSGATVEIDLSGRPAPWRVLEPTVLIGGDADEARWRDALAKVGVWLRSGIGTDLMVRFLVHADITPDQIDSLYGLGIEPDRIVRADPHGIRRFDKLLVPSVDLPDRPPDVVPVISPAAPAPEVDCDVSPSTLGRFPSLAGRF